MLRSQLTPVSYLVPGKAMEISELFRSPSDHIVDFFRAQVQLYREDPALHDYFMALQHNGLVKAPAALNGVGARSRSFPVRIADRVSRIRGRRKLKANVLVCWNPHFGRPTETRFLIRTLIGIAETGASVICLLPFDAPQKQIADALVAVGLLSRVHFVDPAVRGSAEAMIRRSMARERASAAHETITRSLHPLGLAPNAAAGEWFQMMAKHVEDWSKVEDSLEFDSVVARCHWLPLCSAVCRTGMERKLPVITFQQGVIGHSLDAPMIATKFVAFGQSSAAFMGALNSEFYKAAKLPEPSVEYIPSGSLIDGIQELPNQFSRRTLLIVDVPTGHSDFYGVGAQSSALLQLAARVLEAGSSVERVIIRPHPFWSDLDFTECRNIALQHPGKCEISHPSWSLQDDLQRSSAVVGIFSGVVTVASACGVPSIFLQTENGYSTGDLAVFSPEQTLLPDQAFQAIQTMMADENAYNRARSEALANARNYYANGSMLELNGSFFESVLNSATAQPEGARL